MIQRLSLVLLALCATAFAATAEAQTWPSAPHSNDCCDMGAKRVQLGAIDNSTSAGGGYKYYQGVSTFLTPGSQNTITITRGSFSSQKSGAWIDFNLDGDFNDPGEQIHYQSYVPTTVSKSFTVPANATPGITRLRVRHCYTFYSLSSTGTAYYGDTEDYDIIVGVPLGIDVSTPVQAFAGLEFAGQIPITGGAAPFNYNITNIENGEWLKFDPNTGRLFGTPPASLGGGESRVTVRVEDSTADVVEETMTVQFREPLALPYLDDMEGANVGNYQITTGYNAQANLLPLGGQTGNGLVLASNADGSWPLETTTSPSTLTVLNTPAHWDGGSAPDPSTYHGSTTFMLDVTDLRKVNVEFDYSIVNQAVDPGKEFWVQFVVEYAEASGLPAWQSVGGDNPPVTGFYRASTGFTQETVEIPLSGNHDSLGVRMRWMIRNKHDSASPTYVAIDNLRAYVPPQITNSTSLPSVRATEPFPTQDLNITGGQPPYLVTVAPTNPILAGLNMGIEQDPMTMEWRLSAIDGKGPAEGVLGVKDFDLVVTDGNGDKYQNTYSIVVTPAPPLLTLETESLPSTKSGVMYEYDIRVTGGLLPYVYSLSTNAPAWISITTIDDNTARISANIDESIPYDDYVFTVIVDDLINSRVSRQYTLSVVKELAVKDDPIPDAEEGRTFQHFLEADGGSAPYEWTISGGNKPAGIKLNAETGELFGVPYAGQVGDRTFTVQVRDSGVQVATQEFTISVNAPSTNTLQVETTSTALGTLRANADISRPLFTFGGVPPYVYTPINSTGLPQGVSLSEDGRLEGAPVNGTEGAYLLRVRVQDAAAASIIVNVSYNVDAEYLMPEIATSTINFQQNINDPGTPRKVGDEFTILLKVDGGIPPYEWKVADGSVLPDGLILDGIAGRIYGTLRPASLAQTPVGFTLEVTDGADNVATRLIGGTILPGEYPALFVSETQTFAPGLAGGGHYSDAIELSGGVAPYRWQLIGGSLPFGLVISQNGTIHGNIPASEVGNYIFTVRVTDDFETSTEATLSLAVVLDGSQIDTPEGPPADGLSNLNTAEGTAGGCALGSNASMLWMLLLAAMALVVVRRRSEA